MNGLTPTDQSGGGSAGDGNPLRLVVLIPVFNDWESAGVVVRRLGEAFEAAAGGDGGQARPEVTVVLADDCSTQERPPTFLADGPPLKLAGVEVLRLRRNLGHQRAIAIGLCHVFEKHPCGAVLVMDGDGEDRPEDAPRLVARFEELGRKKVVFAQRTKRSEQLSFRLGYRAYRFLHVAATGIAVRVGNFSVMPARALSTLVVVGEVWNHYAAAVFKARVPYDMLPTPRGTRVSGRSHMNFTSLVTHGLSAISVFSETVGVRLTAAAFALCAAFVGALAAVIVIRFGTNLAIAGWATNAFGLLLVALFQVLSISLGMTLFTLFQRNNLGFLPLRDYVYFVESSEPIYRQGGESAHV